VEDDAYMNFMAFMEGKGMTEVLRNRKGQWKRFWVFGKDC
jgi:hypothetical protein